MRTILDISFTGLLPCALGRRAEDTETRGWTWQALCLVVSLEGFVSQIIDMILLSWSCYFLISGS
ncbi:unnamed protein product [Trifolium pratense]|uniref:Uncharacterized protein n=2 Tax=Trifolium pratense TaxID=57577 RepID=A0ACB0LTQ4_TRIPR|nr:unnamed protein product [Trifolium pratense]CAJ2673027.1 unnamed protein product [Trifolium pratense]